MPWGRVHERDHRRILPHARYRAEAETAETLMTSPVATARADWSLVETARVMHRRKLKRLPVVDEAGRLTGIVSRSDLLSHFLRKDDEIREEIERDVLLNALWLPANAARVTVDDGVVTLSGTVERKSLVPVIAAMCRSLDGLVAVRQTLGHQVDDTVPGTTPPAVAGAALGPRNAEQSAPNRCGPPTGKRQGRRRRLLDLTATTEPGEGSASKGGVHRGICRHHRRPTGDAFRPSD
ncbi:CBS domain-containing protein [Kitasatospora sp. NPDC051914]|uniref:CBS domain-containing protein n=1 Tax=Kitasatospora sp. NPDC051914 TaxID=3154945 RepID=UPI0034365B8C